jgi:predicted nucleic acid-binding protein
LSVPKIVIHADVLLDHITPHDRAMPSVLRLAMGKFFCYTTVFQAIELFAGARNADEVQLLDDVMSAMKILGLNPKNAKSYGALMASHRKVQSLEVLTAGLCMESRLPILSARKTLRRIPGVVVVPPALVRSQQSGHEIMRALTTVSA